MALKDRRGADVLSGSVIRTWAELRRLPRLASTMRVGLRGTVLQGQRWLSKTDGARMFLADRLFARVRSFGDCRGSLLRCVLDFVGPSYRVSDGSQRQM